MRFKIVKTSPLFSKLQELSAKITKVEAASRALVKKMGFKEFRPQSFVLAGGISAVASATKIEGYAYAFGPKSQHELFPKKIKANKELLDEINNLPVVEYEELNNILKYDGRKSNEGNGRGGLRISLHPGIVFKKNVVLVDTADYVDYKPITGMKEITTSEYNKLNARKKPARKKK